MLNENRINKQLKLRKSLDYHHLRQAGIAHLQKLAGSIWSDYNTHDPGVTMLETLCYAITELSYRCNFPIEDLLAGNPENKIGDSPDFFEAHQILPSHPLTNLDYRKLLIDLPFVRNAWLEPAESDGPKVFYSETRKALTYDESESADTPNEPVNLRGLYNVWIELAEDDELGNLNSSIIDFDITIVDGTDRHPARVSAYFPHYSAVADDWKTETDLDEINTLITLNPDPWYDLNLRVQANSPDGPLENIHLRLSIDAGEFNWRTKEAQVRKKIADFIRENGQDGMMALFNRKMALIKQYLSDVRTYLNLHRNLCEDFQQINLVKPQEIAIEAEIGLSLDADPHQVIAAALYEIQKQLSPPIRFFSLSELLDEQWSTEDIFEGPLLRHGFIKDEHLTAFRHGKTIYVSDMFNAFMSSNPEKIRYVTGFRLSNYIENIQISKPNSDVLQLHRSDDYKPVVGLRKSRIYCKKGDVYQQVDWRRVETLFLDMIKAGEPDKSIIPDLRLKVPEGRNRNVAHYTSIQEDLPPTYATGSNGLPPNAAPSRKARAQQLKAYLLFYDQLFTNFLAQLANIKNIFSIDGDVSKTYFEQAVYNVPGVMHLLRDFIADQGEGAQQSLLDEAWKLFTADNNNEYLTALSDLNEDEATFLDRRNRFLDHLMARFNEQFTDYSLLMFAQQNQQITPTLLNNKAEFLNAYPGLSSNRPASFNAHADQENIWDTTNVSGLEKRVAHMLGISDYSRRFLAKGPFGNIQFYQELDNDNIDEYRFRVLSNDNRILLSSHRHYHVLNDGYDIVFRMLEYGRNEDNYKVFVAVNGAYYFNLTDENDRILARRIQPFSSEAEALEAVSEVAGFISAHFEGVNDEPDEGMLVIEHLLLRPKHNEIIEGEEVRNVLLPVFSDDYGEIITEGKDPYSFRITVVFPAQSARFSDQNFSALAERTLRLETPAHIMPHVYFLNNLQLSRLEHAYKNWLELNALPIPTDPAARVSHLKQLNQALFEIEGAMQFVPDEPDF